MLASNNLTSIEKAESRKKAKNCALHARMPLQFRFISLCLKGLLWLPLKIFCSKRMSVSG